MHNKRLPQKCKIVKTNRFVKQNDLWNREKVERNAYNRKKLRNILKDSKPL
jgi:hypothetical protein